MVNHCKSRGALLAAALFAITGCGDNDKGVVVVNSTPNVSITATATTGTAPLAVQFFSTVSGGNGTLAYAWDFGDGTTSESPNPAHTFDAAGSPYMVTLIVSDEDGDTGASSIAIVVGSNEVPTVMASAAPTSGAAPLTVDLDCTAAGGNAPVSVTWHFGEGTTDVSATTAFTYTQPGTYRAQCRAVDADGDVATDSVDIVVGQNAIPEAVISAAPGSGRAPLDVDFVGTAIGGDGTVTYAWNFGDGTMDSGANVSHRYTTAGVYAVVLTVTDSDGDTGIATFTVAVSPANLPPVAMASVSAGACAVTGQTSVLLDATASSDPEGAALQYSWVFVTMPPDSQASFNNATIANPSFLPDAQGIYQVRVFVSDGMNVSASSILAIESSGPTNLAAIAGSGQTGGVGTELPIDPEVEVSNTCGALVPSAAVQWTGSNATAQPSVSFTNSNGRATTNVTLGGDLGVAEVTATLLGTGETVTFSFTAVPGPVARVWMDETGATQVGNTPVTVTFRAFDAFDNPVTEVVGFDVDIAALPTSATIDSDGDGDCTTGVGDTRINGVTTTAGIATLDVCNTVAEKVYVAIENVVSSTPGPVLVGGDVTWMTDDFETDTGAYTSTDPRNPWELGPPIYPPGLTGYSPVQVRGTVLGGQLDTAGSFFGNYTLLRTTLDTTYPIGSVYSATLDFNHFYDTLFSPSAGCESNAQLWANCYDCLLLEPEGGYNSSDCAYNGRAAFAGTNANFEPVRFDLGSIAGDATEVLWSVTYYEMSGGAGWYIDDLRLWGKVQYPRISFVAGPITDVRVEADNDGVVMACAPVTISGVVTDQFGNPSDATGVEITLTATGAAEFVAVIVGQNFAPGVPPSTATVETVTGAFSVVLADSAAAAESVTVTGAITGQPVGPEGTAVARFNDPLASEDAGPGTCTDGVDNDCDGAVDCNDGDCATVPACQIEICLNGGDDNGNGLTDCEDPQCYGTGECDSQLYGADACNGIDDEDRHGVQAVDELACNCLDNTGCDDIDFGDYNAPYVCQTLMAPFTPTGRAFCAPDCRVFDWCQLEGLACEVTTGECYI